MTRGQISAWVLVVVVLASVRPAWAAPSETEWLRVGLQWSAELRSGGQDAPSPGLDYDGWTPAVLGLEVEAFAPSLPWLGGFLTVEREGFSLLDRDNPLLSGGLWRVRVGPHGRWSTGPLSLSGGVGYGLTQLPWFGDPQSLTFEALARHELVVRASVGLELPATLRLSAGGELSALRFGGDLAPEGLGVALSAGLSAQVSELTPGTAVRAGVSYGWIHDRFGRVAVGPAQQQLHRLAVGLSLHLSPPVAVVDTPVAPPEAQAPEPPKEEAPPPPELVLRVTARGGETPLPGAVADVSGAVTEAGENGRIVLSELGVGTHSIEVRAPGHRPVTEVVELIEGQSLTLDVQLQPEAIAAPAVVVGQVRSAATGGPLRAVLRVQGTAREVTADRRGQFTLELPAGSYRIIISANDHLSQRKLLRLRSGERAIFNVELHPERR